MHVGSVAGQLKDLDSTESLDVRRSQAVGELARRQLSLEFSVVEEGAPRPPRNHPRKGVLYVHLSEEALTGAPGIARVEQGNHLVTTGQVHDWCAVADQVTVQPVSSRRPPTTPTGPPRHPCRSTDANRTAPT